MEYEDLFLQDMTQFESPSTPKTLGLPVMRRIVNLPPGKDQFNQARTKNFEVTIEFSNLLNKPFWVQFKERLRQ